MASSSDRKGAQTTLKARTTSLVGALKQRFARRQRREHGEEEDAVVWDVPNPFSPPDPDLAYVHALIQQEIARMRRGESIGPLDDDPKSESEYSYGEEQLRAAESPSTSTAEGHTAPWADLVRAHNDLVDAEAEERALRAKRDAQRSRAKAIAILGPEASAALQR